MVAIAQSVRDILEQRVDEASVPAWCARRGWESFLLGLDETTLRRCEAQGLASELASLPGAPAELLALGRDIAAAVALPRLDGARGLLAESLRKVKLR